MSAATVSEMWVTKYALTKGVFLAEVSVREQSWAYLVRDGRVSFHTSLKVGKDCFEDRGEAIAAAENMRERKIASLQKQIDKFQSLSF